MTLIFDPYDLDIPQRFRGCQGICPREISLSQVHFAAVHEIVLTAKKINRNTATMLKTILPSPPRAVIMPIKFAEQKMDVCQGRSRWNWSKKHDGQAQIDLTDRTWNAIRAARARVALSILYGYRCWRLLHTGRVELERTGGEREGWEPGTQWRQAKFWTFVCFFALFWNCNTYKDTKAQ